MPKMVNKSRAVNPKDLKVYPPDEYPYELEVKYGKPKFYKTFAAVQAAIHNDLDALYHQWSRLNDTRAMRAVEEAKQAVDVLSPEGDALDVTVDPWTGTRYQAQIIRRQAPSE